jgi:hypothetical protein
MGMVIYYARLDDGQLARAAASPDILNARDLSGMPGADRIDIDRAHEALCFLLCQTSRDGRRWNHAVMRKEPLPDRRPGNELSTVARAISGATLNRVETIDWGYGPAAIFSPTEVQEFAGALSAVTSETLREHADFTEMERLGIPPAGWNKEGDAIMREYVEPSLRRLAAFYAAAADAGQNALVWYT